MEGSVVVAVCAEETAAMSLEVCGQDAHNPYVPTRYGFKAAKDREIGDQGN
jgi:hypothetical protein